MEPPVSLHQNLSVARSVYHGVSSAPMFVKLEELMGQVFADDYVSKAEAAIAADDEQQRGGADAAAADGAVAAFLEMRQASLEFLKSEVWEDQAAGHLLVAVSCGQ